MARRMLAVLVLLLGCGRVGNIRPPEATAPAPVQLLTAEGHVDGLLLKWQAPTEDATGGRLRSLDHYLIQRSDYRKGEVPDFTTIAEVQPPDKPEPTASPTPTPDGKKSRDSAFGLRGPAAQKFGAPLSYLDNTTEVGKRYDYRVLAVNESGTRGRADLILRVSYAGEASRIENIAVTLPK